MADTGDSFVDSPEFTILIVDDDADFRAVIRHFLEHEYKILEATDASGALEAAASADLVLLDLDLGSGARQGLWVLDRLRAALPGLPVVTLSAFHETEIVDLAVNAGAAHCLDKPPQGSELLECLRRTILRAEKRVSCERFLGDTQSIEEIRARARLVAAADLPVLILGETGTGKSLLARCMHSWSSARDGSFRSIQGPTLPAELLEAESRGPVEGTVLLDGIASFSAESQLKLVRALENARLRWRDADSSTSLRVLASADQNLGDLVDEGTIRSDLWHRLRGETLSIPPLRADPERIRVLAKAFLGGGRHIAGAALDRLMSYSWPGNVRELKWAMERAQIYAGEDDITADVIARALESVSVVKTATPVEDELFEMPLKQACEQLKYRFQRAYLHRLLRRHRWNKTRVAEASGLARGHLHHLLKKLELSGGDDE